MQLLKTTTQRQQQKKLRIFEQGKSSWGWDFPKTKTRDTASQFST